MKLLKPNKPVLSMLEFRRRGKQWLKTIQQELKCDNADKDIAINIDTGEYVLEDETGEDVFFVFRKKWPDAHPYICRVNGRPSIRFYGK
ncbi:MAG: hypothetical protein AAB288_14500 [Acidobacteriota bacterium]